MIKKMTQVVLAGVLFLSTSIATAQINTRTGGGSNILANSPTTNTNVGIGTNTPKSKLDVKGSLTVGDTYGGVTAAPENGAIIEGNVGIGIPNPTAKLEVMGAVKATQGIFTTTSLPNGYVFINSADRNDKCGVLDVGSIIGTGSGYLNTRMFNFYDFPQSNIDAKSTLFFGIEDRNDFGRYRFIAETGGKTQMIMLNKSQQETMKIYEDGNDNVFMHFPKPNSRVVIGCFGDYLPEHKFVVRGSAKIEGNILTDENIGIGSSNFVDGTDTFKLSVKGAIRADRVKVYTTWADFVFEKNYKLPKLEEVEKHIAEKGHLKDIPSAKEVESKGIELGEMNKLLLQKVEELTLYIIEMNKEIQQLKAQIKNQ